MYKVVKYSLKVLLIVVLILFTYLFYKINIWHPNLKYPYNVKQDYKYEFDNSIVKTHSINIVNNEIILPKGMDFNSTIFLKVSLESTVLGKFIEPSIKLQSNRKELVQYFENDMKGIRYLNISSLRLSKENNKINLIPKHIIIKSKTLQLISFSDEEIKNKRVLIIAPHPDDAEIAAYGLYSSNKNSFILTITSGDGGKNKYDEIYNIKEKQYLKKGELRTWNSITVPLLGGIPPNQCVNLGFFNGSLSDMYQNFKLKDESSITSNVLTNISDISTYRNINVSDIAKNLNGKSNWKSLVSNLEYILITVKPEIIVLPYPVLDHHPEHKLSSIALFEAIKNLKIKNGKLYFYTNHYTLNEHYPHGKLGGTISLPPNFNDTIFFDSIYSHTLTNDMQNDKIFALEAMNDLRPDTEWRFTKGSLKYTLSNFKRDIFGVDNSYYRRAIRSNELFFVVDVKNLYSKEKIKKLLVILWIKKKCWHINILSVS